MDCCDTAPSRRYIAVAQLLLGCVLLLLLPLAEHNLSGKYNCLGHDKEYTNEDECESFCVTEEDWGCSEYGMFHTEGMVLAGLTIIPGLFLAAPRPTPAVYGIVVISNSILAILYIAFTLGWFVNGVMNLGIWMEWVYPIVAIALVAVFVTIAGAHCARRCRQKDLTMGMLSDLK